MTICLESTRRGQRARPVRAGHELRRLADEASRKLAGADAEDVVAWAAAEFGPRLAVTSSMTDAVVAHLTATAQPGVDVLFLDTGYHFAETIETREAVAAVLRANVIDIRPVESVAEQDASHGPALHARDPGQCCALRKVAPLAWALAPYEAWVTGVRRADGPGRRRTKVVEYDLRRRMVKINPIVEWSDEDVATYAAQHDLPINPLVARGYPSIGCAPCTQAPEPGEGGRSGRWAGTDKTECGLHR